MQCPVCGLDLTTREAGELWQTLQRADVQLEVARAAGPAEAAPQPAREGVQPPQAVAPPHAAPAPPQAPRTPEQPAAAADPFASVHRPYPAPASPAAPVARSGPEWSVGTVLLTLGAFGLVVAAIIFVARSWDTIGLVGKASILAVATALVAAVAVWVTRRPLRASAEALWSVTASVVALDVLGARSEGLAGLDSVDGSWIAIVAGAAFAFGSGGVVIWARRHLDRDLVSMSFAAVGGVLSAATGATLVGSHDNAFWHVFVGLLVAGGLGLALRFTRSRVIAIGARVVLAVFYVVAAALALVELVDHPTVAELVGDAHGLPVLLMSLATIGVGAAIPSLRLAASAVAALGLTALVVVPATEIDTDVVAQGEGGLIAVVVLATIGAAVLARGSGAWIRGLRLATGLLALASVILVAWWFVEQTVLVVSAAAGGWGFGADPSDLVADQGITPGLGLVVTVVAAVGAVAQSWLLTRWPELGEVPPNPGLAVAATSGFLGVLTAADPTLAVHAAVVLVGAAVAVLVARSTASGWFHASGAVLAWTAAALGFVDESIAVWVWPVAVLLLATAAWAARPPVRSIEAVLLAPLTAGFGVAALAIADVGSPVPQLAAVLLAAAVVTGVALLLSADEVTTVTVQVSAVVVMVGAAVTADTALQASAIVTVAGAATLALATITPLRTEMIVLGTAELVVAYVLLLVAGSVDAVEAYTLPPGLAALAAGWWFRRRRPDLSTWSALGAGLALSLLPSLPQALADPTGVRALALGAAALALVAVGVRLSWQAPFVGGVVVLALILLVNIGPYAQAAPRVVIIAVVSAVLVGLGITWEDRVRDGRRLAAFVKEMS